MDEVEAVAALALLILAGTQGKGKEKRETSVMETASTTTELTVVTRETPHCQGEWEGEG